MWLIDTTSRRLKAVPDSAGFKYAILSHTWRRSGEPTYQDMQQPEREGPKFDKIRETCRLAKSRGIPYAWVDTCCIDKTSSAELAEAINSMFRWYKEAVVCFAYLEDFGLDQAINEMSWSNWFRRGWTLQELIASKNLEIYDTTWVPRGDKSSLRGLISHATKVDKEVLDDSALLPTISIARRMSWAAGRQTSRTEDLAYCLFGIFGVHLPMIYGEGERAFLRLQEAIAQESNDMSLFAWTSSQRSEDQKYWGIFARSPSYFSSCDQIYHLDSPSYPPNEFTMTNRGVRLAGRIHDSQTQSGEHDVLLDLECADGSRQQGDGSRNLVFIRLVPVPNGYVRHCCQGHAHSSLAHIGSTQSQTIHIPKAISDKESRSLDLRLQQVFYVSIANTTSSTVSINRHAPYHLWKPKKQCFMTDGNPYFVAIFEMSISGDKFELVSLTPETNDKDEILPTALPSRSPTPPNPAFNQKISWPDFVVVLGLNLENPNDLYSHSNIGLAEFNPGLPYTIPKMI